MREHDEKSGLNCEQEQQNGFRPAPPPAPSDSRGQGTGSPYCQRDYSGYVRKRDPARPPYSSTYGSTRPGVQYRPGSEWYPPPGEQYQWNFAEYDSALPQKARKGKARGLVVFAVAMLCVISVGVLSVIGLNVFEAITDSPYTVSENGYTGELPPPPGEVSGGEVNITIERRPPSEDYTPAVGELMTIPQVARVVRPSVVGIINYRTNQILMPATEGSGIILSENGYIITNAHVVEQAESIVVVLADGTDYLAELVGADVRTDLAVLRINRTGLPAAVFGDSNQLEVGETVIAIGNPGGLELAGTVTRGVVSAVDRVVSTPYNSTTYIQTDAAINPGNSGGPLSNEFGQVIGINTAKIVEVGYEGIGFAIPISDAIPIIEELIRNGRVTGRALLGITGQNVDEVIARNNNVPAGVQIQGISSDELSGRGVMPGDIVTHMNGQRIFNLNDMRNILSTKQVGELVLLTLHRPGRPGGMGNTFEVEVRLIEDAG